MANATSGDDYWHESSFSGNNFFDDDSDSVIPESDVCSELLEQNTVLPIHSIISNKCLTNILDDINWTMEYVVPSPEEAVQKMFNGRTVPLNIYQTLEQKLQLLDAALDIADGNIITMVILFLCKSLKRNIFFNQLSKRKVAIKHYASYLIEKNDLSNLADLYMATGNISNLKDIYYLLAKDVQTTNALLKKLEQFHLHHAENFSCLQDKLEIQDNMAFLDFQIRSQQYSKSLIDQLTTLYRQEWEKNKSAEITSSLKRQFKVDDFQYDWLTMSVLCKMQNWDALTDIFIKTTWVIKKPSLKSAIKPDIFVIGLSRYKPPESVTKQFLLCLNDVGRSLYLAEKLRIHSFVISYHKDQKDKISLLKYMERIEPGSDALHSIQLCLNNPDIKWKN